MKPDRELQRALADLTFKTVKDGLASMSLSRDPAWEPLADCHIEIKPVSDYEALAVVNGRGDTHYFMIKVHHDNMKP